LFGLAVLLTTAAALSVPWFRMEALVLEQPFRESQRIADEFFLDVLASPGGPAGGGLHGDDASLLSGRTRAATRFHKYSADPSDPESLTHDLAEDEFLAAAARRFLRHPGEDFVYTTDRAKSASALFRYAQAVRVTRSCLTCHSETGTATPYRENELAGFISVDVPAAETETYLWFNRMWILLAGGIAGVLAILVFYVITKRFILAPIQELRAVAVSVADGDLDKRADVQTGDEFEQLSDRMNFMLERLRDSRDELKHANKLLDQKLGEMAETNVALYESNRLKSDFLANVSHELRTPLTSIIGFAELLREGRPDEEPEKCARYSENILISGRILLEIINDLLDLAKIEAGKISLSLEPVRVEEICSTLIDFTKPLADKKKLWVVFEPEPELPLMTTDKGRLRQILYNFLSNAIKFSPEHGRITLRAERAADDKVLLSVRDAGPGVRPQDRNMIFEKFRQADQSNTREHEGTGLGLTIAKQLTLLLGGEIGVDSGSDKSDKGAVFWVRLPVTTTGSTETQAISLT
jgi:signal transduction histidine kinase